MVPSYLDIGRYINGTERLPFQYRVLPALILRQLLQHPLSGSLVRSAKGVMAHPALTYLFLIDLCAFAATAFFCLRLYDRTSPTQSLRPFVYPILLYTMTWTYLIHTEQNFYYPYDMLSLAFFTAGLYFIYTRQIFALFFVILLGTINRETTIFLILLYLVDALRTESRGKLSSLLWVRVAALLAVWFAVKHVIHLSYMNNDSSESYFRLRENFDNSSIKNWPEMLAGCGFLLPVVWAFHKHIPNTRLMRWVFLIPVWIVAVVCYGVCRETRVYGELCAFIAVTATMLLEVYCERRASTRVALTTP